MSTKQIENKGEIEPEKPHGNNNVQGKTTGELVKNLSIPKNPNDFSEYINNNIDKLTLILKSSIDSQTNIYNGLSNSLFLEQIGGIREYQDIFLNKLGIILGSKNKQQIINLSGNGGIITFEIGNEIYYYINYFEEYSNLRLNETQFESFKKQYGIQVTHDLNLAWNKIISKIESLIMKGYGKDEIFDKWYEYVQVHLSFINVKETELFDHIEKLQRITAYPQNVYNVNIVENMIAFIYDLEYNDDGVTTKLPPLNDEEISKYINKNLKRLLNYIKLAVESNGGGINIDQLGMYLHESLFEKGNKNLSNLNNIFDFFSIDDSFGYGGPDSIEKNIKNKISMNGTIETIKKLKYNKINNMFGAHKIDSDYFVGSPQNANLEENENFVGNDNGEQDSYLIIGELIYSFLNKLSINHQYFLCLDDKYELSFVNGGEYEYFLLIENYGENNKYLISKEAFENFILEKNIKIVGDNKSGIEIILSNLNIIGNIIENNKYLKNLFIKLLCEKLEIEKIESVTLGKIKIKLKTYTNKEISMESKFYIETLYKSICEMKDIVGLNGIPCPDENNINNLNDFVYENMFIIQGKIIRNLNGIGDNSKMINALTKKDFNGNVGEEIINEIIKSLAEIKIWGKKTPISTNLLGNPKCLVIEIGGKNILFAKYENNLRVISNPLNSSDNHFDIGNYKLIGNVELLDMQYPGLTKPILVNNYSDPIVEIYNKYEMLKKLDIDEFYLKEQIIKAVKKCNGDFINVINNIVNKKFSQILHEEIIGDLYIPSFDFNEIYSMDEALRYIFSTINSGYYNSYYKNGLITIIMEQFDYLINKYSILKNSIN
ncbi:MAG: hypothetical protein V3575_05555 [Candidatus Absconditabacteria bacterium]